MKQIVELLVLLFAILAVFGTAAWAGIRAAPWVPTRTRDIRRLLRLAKVLPGETVHDLGCGDGRVLLLAAQEFNARGIGYECSLLPYLAAKIRVALSPFRKQIRIRWADFFHVPLSDADVVFCFLTPAAMKNLKTKFVQELKPGARVVSYAFSLQDLPHVLKDKPDEKTAAAYLYRR